MSKENMADHPHNKLNNFRNKDELNDISHSSETINSTDKLILSNIYEKNNFKTSTMLTNTNDTSHKKKIGANIVHGSSHLDEAECEFLIEKITSNETILNSQDESLLHKVVEKNLNCNIFNSSTDLLYLNTQQFMDFNLKTAFQQLNAFPPTLNSNSSKTHTIKRINSDNSTVIAPLPLINESRDSEIKNKNSVIVNDPKKSEKINYPSPKIDHELSIRDHYVEYPGEDQDAEIIAFQAMCEALLKIGAVDNNIIDNNKTIVKKHNELNDNEIGCSDSTEYEPTSKLNSFKGNDISKRLALKRRQINDLMFDSSNGSSLEYSNELSSKQCNSKSNSGTTMIQPKNVKRKKLSNLTLKDKEIDCILIENKLPKVQNVVNDTLKYKKTNDDELTLLKDKTIFYVSKNGKVHNDILNSVAKKNYHSV